MENKEIENAIRQLQTRFNQLVGSIQKYQENNKESDAELQRELIDKATELSEQIGKLKEETDRKDFQQDNRIQQNTSAITNTENALKAVVVTQTDKDNNQDSRINEVLESADKSKNISLGISVTALVFSVVGIILGIIGIVS